MIESRAAGGWEELALFSIRLRSWLLVVAVVFLCLPVSGCTKLKALAGKKTNIEVEKATLDADPLAAAREVGGAAGTATAKDEAALAGKLLALLDRLGVAVVSTDGKKLVATGPIASPPKEVFFWEPMVVGLARATAKGDTKNMSTLAHAYFPKGDVALLEEVDFPAMFASLARRATNEKATTNDAILVVAIAEDLAKRGDKDPDPRIDPIGGALFGLWMSMAAAGAPANAAPSGAPSAMPPVKNDLSRALRNQMGGAICDFMNSAREKASSALGLFGKVGRFIPGRLGSVAGAMDDFMKALGDYKDAVAGKPIELAQTIMSGIAGMAIAAFIDVDGDVKPTKVKYGDGPVKYEVTVDSKNPFTEEQLKSFVGCLKASTPGIGDVWEPLDDIPPPGPASGVPVVWSNWAKLDPRHGTFTVEPGNGAPPKGLMEELKNAGKKLAAAGKVSITDDQGKARATFQVSNKKVEKVTTVVRSYLVFANVFPFPISKNPVYLASNIISSREIPLRLEVEVPFPRNWNLVYTYSSIVSGGGMMGGWKMTMEATVPFTLDPSDPKMRFKANGTGTWKFSFDGSMGGGFMQCEAPATAQPLDVEVTGAVTNAETFSTDFTMDVQGRGKVNTNLKCKVMGQTADIPMAGPVDGKNAAAELGFSRFTMTLDEGASRTFPISRGGMTGSAKVVLTPRD